MENPDAVQKMPDLMECGSSLGDIDPLAVIVGAANAADAKLRSQFSRVVVVDGICPALILKCRKDRPILLRSGRRASTTMSLLLTLPKSWFV